jgi:hypothetical protein
MTTQPHFLKVIALVMAMVTAFTLFACEKKEETNGYDSMAERDPSVLNNTDSSSIIEEDLIDIPRKFIRTAEIKFKVKNVATATYKIESMISKFQGFVTLTNLSSNVNHQTINRISADSSLESTCYTVTNNIVLRVPNTNLDSALNELTNMIDYLDYRIIKSDDVGLQLLSNNLTIQRLAKHERRLRGAIDIRGKKLRETGMAEESLLYKKEMEDNANISNISLLDQVNYSTVNLTIYQGQETRRELILNEQAIEYYEPGFGLKLIDSVKDGWKILESIILFIFKIWGLILIGIALFFIYRKLSFKAKK